MNEQHVYGKHRGTVINNVDPETSGRLQVSVPSVYGSNTLNWAMPCTPYAGPSQGLYLMPPIGANVWVEFEGGDINYPIWAGCFWGSGECPGSIPQEMILQTQTATITLSDAEGVTIETTVGHKIELSAQGVTISSNAGATVELQGPKVAINGSALEVI